MFHCNQRAITSQVMDSFSLIQKHLIPVLCLDITADRRSEEVDEGQVCQEKFQETTSTEDREDSNEESHIYTTTGTCILVKVSTC